MSELSTLYHKGKGGALYQWRVWTEGDEIFTEYGIVDGKLQTTSKIATPKNVGKRNETTGPQQAEIEARAMHKLKLDRKYSETPDEAQGTVFLPMLAHAFEKKEKRVGYPVHVQPKLDGVRALAFWNADGQIELMSRGGKTWDVPHIAAQIAAFLPEGHVLDGEIYLHGVTFQQVTRLVKKHRPGETEKLEYHVYDCVVVQEGLEENKIWASRYADLIRVEGLIPDYANIKVVTTDTAPNRDEIFRLFGQYTEGGYEGAIVRTWDGIYRFGYRSSQLLKVKVFQDAEFTIVGFNSGKGRYSDCVVWVCRTEDGNEFNVLPQGTLEQKRAWLAEADDHVGSLLKVKFFERSEDGVPRFPVGLGIRATEDVS